jgi:hypothetical protein
MNCSTSCAAKGYFFADKIPEYSLLGFGSALKILIITSWPVTKGSTASYQHRRVRAKTIGKWCR